MRKYFFIGISGISMSAIAVILKSAGNEVRGYDQNRCHWLEENGIRVETKQNYESVSWADEIVFSSAFSFDFPLLKFAIEAGKKVTVRGEMLGRISSEYEKVIAVAGSHGKSTTTAMIYNILRVAGKNPTLHLGAKLIDSGKNYDLSDHEYFVTEACEYHDNFLFLQPYLSVVTNIEPEHLDYFKSFSIEKASYAKFIAASENSVVKHDFKARNIRLDKFGNIIFDVFKSGKRWGRLHLKIGGIYNAENALYAIAAAEKLGIAKCYIVLGLENFCGLEKRFERVGSNLKANVFVDYAHHPKEIEKAYNSVAKLGGKNIAIFQPHTYSRTAAFLDDFAEVLSKFDETILFKTYAAREVEQPEIEIQLLQNIAKRGKKVTLFYDENAFLNEIDNFDGDNLIILGAGDLPEILQQRKFIWKL